MHLGTFLVRLVKLALIGPRLEEASLRHAKAADRLDTMVREVLGR